jgi:hypothetical protein
MASNLDVGRVHLPPGVDRLPFVGARPFARADTAYFCGRDDETRKLANLVGVNSLSVLYGESGVGKSSLINSKLPLELERIEPDWVIVNFFEWQPNCFPKLCEMASDKTGYKITHFASDLASFASGGSDETPVLLALDQFEEYFLYHPYGDEIFEAELAKLANQRRGVVRVLLSLRSDGLFLLDRFRLRIPTIFNNMMLVEPLRVNAAEEAIIKPVSTYRKSADPKFVVPAADSSLVKALVEGSREVEIQRAAPSGGRGETGQTGRRDFVVAPFLQLALQSLWQEDVVRHHRHELRFETLLELAGIQARESPNLAVGKLAQNYVNDVLNEYSDEQKAICARVFEQMVLPSGSKVSVRSEDFYNKLPADDQVFVRTLLETLSDKEARPLLRRVASSDNRAHFEIMHDALATPLLNWVEGWRRIERERQTLAEAELRTREALEAAQRGAELQLEDIRKRTNRKIKKMAWFTGSVFLIFILLCVTHFGLQSKPNRLSGVAKESMGQDLRSRTLLALTALHEADLHWPLTTRSYQIDAIRSVFRLLPRDGGDFTAVGVSADGNRLARIDRSDLADDQIVTCVLPETKTCALPKFGEPLPNGMASYGLPIAPTEPSAAELLNSFTDRAVGFIGEKNLVYYARGYLYSWQNGDWTLLFDIAKKIDVSALDGLVQVEFVGGKMRIISTNFVKRSMSLFVLREPSSGFFELHQLEWAQNRGGVPEPSPIIGPDTMEYLKLAHFKDGDRPYVRATAKFLNNVDLVIENRLISEVRGGLGGFSADGNYFAIKDADADGISTRALIAESGNYSDANFSVPTEAGTERRNSWFTPPLAAVHVNKAGWRFAWNSDAGLEVWEGAESGGQLRRLHTRERALATGLGAEPYRLNFSRDGRFLIATAFSSSKMLLRVWDLEQGWDETIADAVKERRRLDDLACRIVTFQGSAE